ncbi:HlyC/CorC family transporter [Saccharophagus degradans]|uniref:Metal dependent phosphohydrolase n=2 Tax=Saccharophagus degradans TaxID=86304 RepID=Q21LG7_SACD2|nr:HlyC/CorC family transporter [Saccharophagus degradans]ABD80462.1 metal dependent phosphohydrolase [Saccharophagus degradans 2-40]MBU2984327.1 HlyC/CorC family transporter [Saccharophagus degradans]MDO6422910.1 HlyC/CorC family transporter [Saccharophagus degradans]MDO6607055.1 HlyC/CorC family transporter [Saccharophagus degradans]WGO97344.1 HlyC/CorC family transporter [Saccharophagus degradans]
MDAVSTQLLVVILVGLIICSAFFSSSETGMLSLNRYRLRHLVKKEHKGATLASNLLARPERLIGVILIGNNLVNILIAMVGTAIAERYLSEWAVIVVAPIALTLILLVFAEVTPKSIAAIFPERIAFPASYVLQPLLLLLYPFVLVVNAISNGLARLAGIDLAKAKLSDHLRPEELRTVVDEAGELIPDHHQGMLLNVLDLEKATVEDIMIPRNEVIGIDLDDDIEDIMELIRSTEYTRLPVFEGDINNVVGVLHLRNAARFIQGDNSTVTHDSIREHCSEPYFIPESTPLPTQLMNFQQQKRRTAIVVDEYGEVQGIATLVDLLEEIVGDFSTDTAEDSEPDITECEDDWFLIDGSTSIRDINRQLGWTLSTDGPKTLNGIIVEYLESIPDALVSFEVGNYRFEIVELTETRIEKAKVLEISLQA